jgi:hypothetical protein
VIKTIIEKRIYFIDHIINILAFIIQQEFTVCLYVKNLSGKNIRNNRSKTTQIPVFYIKKKIPPTSKGGPS